MIPLGLKFGTWHAVVNHKKIKYVIYIIVKPGQFSHGRTSPLATDEPDLDSSLPPASNPFTWSDWVQGSPPDRTASPVIPDAQLISYGPPEVHSLPATPTRVWRPDTDFAVPPASAPVDIPIPDSPVPRAARAVSPPMTPPGSITPRFLTWGGNRARTAEIGSSPTPTGRYGSARSRMSVNYISPSLRVLQQRGMEMEKY